MSSFEINRGLVEKLLETVDAGLSSGLGRPIPGNMCVEAAVCYAMGLPHGDNPTCVNPALRSMKIVLNDSRWSSKTARAKGMRRLAVLQLGTKDSGFDEEEFAKKLALATIKKIVPIALRAAGLQYHAERCDTVTTLGKGCAAAHAAADAADAAADAHARAARAAADAARAAALAARSAALAAHAADAAADAHARAARVADAADAASDEILNKFAKIAEDILIEMGVPAVRFIDMF